MAKPRKEGNKFTTIAISWDDKNILRKMSRFKKKTKNGDVYESDAEVIHRLLIGDIDATMSAEPKTTYPSKRQDEAPPSSSV